MTSLRLLELSAVPSTGIREFRATGRWLATVLVGLIVAGGLWAALHSGGQAGKGALPAIIAWWIVFWFGLFWLMLLSAARKSRQPDAWLVRANDAGLFIKWRSYQNVDWGSEGLQVVFVPYALILSARCHQRRWNTPESLAGGQRQQRSTFLELQLGEVETGELSRRLADERDGTPGGRKIVRTRWGDYPLSVEPDQVLRIEWRAKPGVRAMLELLQGHGVDIAPDARSESELQHTASEAELAELARRGDLMTLIRVLRVRDQLSLEAAHRRAKAMIAQLPAGTVKPGGKR